MVHFLDQGLALDDGAAQALLHRLALGHVPGAGEDDAAARRQPGAPLDAAVAAAGGPDPIDEALELV